MALPFSFLPIAWQSANSADMIIVNLVERGRVTSYVLLSRDGKDFFLQKGGKIITLSKEEDARWTKAVSPMIDEYIKAMKAKNLPGDEAVKFCQDWLKSH
jgi:hypothetical protein